MFLDEKAREIRGNAGGVMEQNLDKSLNKAFERARRLLLANAPLLARASESSVAAHAMSASEIGVLESVGLSVTPWRESWQGVTLERPWMA